MTVQLLATVIVCYAMMGRSSGAAVPPPGASHAAETPVDQGNVTTAIENPVDRIRRVYRASESHLAEGRHQDALRLIDGEQKLGTAGSEELDTLRNRILNDQRFRTLLRKADGMFAQQDLRRAINLLRQAGDMRAQAGTDDEHRWIVDRLIMIESEQQYRHGHAAEMRGDFDGARHHYTSAIEATGHIAATESLRRIERTAQRQILIDQGHQANARGDYQQAIEHLRQAISLGADVEVSPLLADAKLSLLLEKARRHADANDLDATVDAYTAAVRMHPEKPELNHALVALRQRQEYVHHLKRGDALAAVDQHVAAKVHYRQAKVVMETDQISQKLEDAEFNSLLTEVRRRLASNDVPGARAMLQTAARTPGGLRQIDKVRELQHRIGRGEN